MTTPILWKGREADFKICNALTSPNTTTTFYAQVDADGQDIEVSSWLKEFTISGSEGDVEKVDLLGETSGFQNAILEHKPWSSVELTGTAVFSGVQADEGLAGLFMVDDTTFGTAITSGEKRYQFGSSTANIRVAKAIGIQLSDGTNIVSIGLNNAYATKVGDIKVTPDNHVEVSFTVKCLGKDYYETFGNS